MCIRDRSTRSGHRELRTIQGGRRSKAHGERHQTCHRSQGVASSHQRTSSESSQVTVRNALGKGARHLDI
eukprot:1004697-Alexandrium_andersonii.AAC.1